MVLMHSEVLICRLAKKRALQPQRYVIIPNILWLSSHIFQYVGLSASFGKPSKSGEKSFNFMTEGGIYGAQVHHLALLGNQYPHLDRSLGWCHLNRLGASAHFQDLFLAPSDATIQRR